MPSSQENTPERDIRYEALNAIPPKEGLFSRLGKIARREKTDTGWSNRTREEVKPRLHLLDRLVVITDTMLLENFEAVEPVDGQRARFTIVTPDTGAPNIVNVRFNTHKRPEFYIVQHYANLTEPEVFDTDPTDSYTVWRHGSYTTQFDTTGPDAATALARLPEPEAA